MTGETFTYGFSSGISPIMGGFRSTIEFIFQKPFLAERLFVGPTVGEAFELIHVFTGNPGRDGGSATPIEPIIEGGGCSMEIFCPSAGRGPELRRAVVLPGQCLIVTVQNASNRSLKFHGWFVGRWVE